MFRKKHINYTLVFWISFTVFTCHVVLVNQNKTFFLSFLSVFLIVFFLFFVSLFPCQLFCVYGRVFLLSLIEAVTLSHLWSQLVFLVTFVVTTGYLVTCVVTAGYLVTFVVTTDYLVTFVVTTGYLVKYVVTAGYLVTFVVTTDNLFTFVVTTG